LELNSPPPNLSVSPAWRHVLAFRLELTGIWLRALRWLRDAQAERREAVQQASVSTSDTLDLPDRSSFVERLQKK
jgi:cytoskeletal protein RodZ